MRDISFKKYKVELWKTVKNILDIAIVPTSLGVNSSLTISALAFRIAGNIVSSANLPVEPVTTSSEKTIYFPK